MLLMSWSQDWSLKKRQAYSDLSTLYKVIQFSKSNLQTGLMSTPRCVVLNCITGFVLTHWNLNEINHSVLMLSVNVTRTWSSTPLASPTRASHKISTVTKKHLRYAKFANFHWDLSLIILTQYFSYNLNMVTKQKGSLDHFLLFLMILNPFPIY